MNTKWGMYINPYILFQAELGPSANSTMKRDEDPPRYDEVDDRSKVVTKDIVEEQFVEGDSISKKLRLNQVQTVMLTSLPL
jgi:hypothetical protein